MMRSVKIVKVTICMLAGVLFCAGQNRPQPPAKPSAEAVSPTPAKPFAEHNPRYAVRAGDSMDLTFAFSPEFNQSVTVQPDGFVTLRDIGDVHVAGLTVPELSEAVKNAYAKVLKDPAVAVVLRDFEKPYFIAAGDVAKPGKYELRGDTTLTEAVAIAGGFDNAAKHSRVVLYRKTSDQWMEGKVVDIKKMMASRNLNEDIHLNPGDMIFVPRSAYSKIKPFIPTPGLGMGFVP
jgi:polysaccharide biosynthesis/export protein